MNDLVKIRDVSLEYGVSARALRYYEDTGLINSIRTDDYAYRMYNKHELTKLEQILILRKLNISIRDIKRIFDSEGSKIILDVLGKKINDIDEEVSLLQKLKNIVMEFITQIEKTDFNNETQVHSLYKKADDMKQWLAESEDTKSNMQALNEVSDKLKKTPEVRVVRLPACKMATSGEPDMTYSKVWDFAKWWETYDKKRHSTNYAPLDFLFGENCGLVWWMMVEDDATSEDCGGYDIIDFEGGLYAVHTSIDEDMESQNLVHEKINKWIETTNFELDDSHPERTYLGHMINPSDEVKQGLGYDQYEIFVPIRLKK